MIYVLIFASLKKNFIEKRRGYCLTDISEHPKPKI